MNLIPAAKLAATSVIGFGTSTIVKSIISNNVPRDDMSLPEETAVVVASYALGAMVADSTRKFTDEKIDTAVRWYNDHVKKTS